MEEDLQTNREVIDQVLYSKYDALLKGSDKTLSPSERLYQLRRLVITHGLPKSRQVSNTLRSKIWKIFLGIGNVVNAEKYARVVKRGPSSFDEEIRNDTFRTFTHDAEFSAAVPETKLSRVLNAFIMQHESSCRYVQGMNILLAPLLFVMPEVDAFYAFKSLVTLHVPRYVAPDLEGVHAGCSLVDEVLNEIDPDLYSHLFSLGVTATIYAFPLVLSAFACSPPLHQLLRLWDVLLATGVHFNIVMIVSHIELLREALVKSDKPMDVMKLLQLRHIPPLDADVLVSVAFKIFHRISPELCYKIARHTLQDPENDERPSFLDSVKKKYVRVTRVVSTNSSSSSTVGRLPWR